MTKQDDRNKEQAELERAHRIDLNIYQRLHKVMEEVSYIQREKRQGMQYSIVSHDAVTGEVRPSMVRWGILTVIPSFQVEQSGTRTELRCVVRFINIDNPSDQLDVVSLGYGLDGLDKGPGKAMSYAVKYALMKTFLMEAGDEDPDIHQSNKLRGEDDPIWQNLKEFVEKMGKAKTADELTKLADQWKGHLSDAAKKYPNDVNSIRADFSKKLAAAKEKDQK